MSTSGAILILFLSMSVLQGRNSCLWEPFSLFFWAGHTDKLPILFHKVWRAWEKTVRRCLRARLIRWRFSRRRGSHRQTGSCSHWIWAGPRILPDRGWPRRGLRNNVFRLTTVLLSLSPLLSFLTDFAMWWSLLTSCTLSNDVAWNVR